MRLLNAALAMEHRLAAIYTAAAAVPAGRSARDTVERLRRHEAEHARGLEEAIRDLGGTPDAALPAAEYRTLLRLRSLTTPADIWRLAMRLENQTIAAYLEALPKLSIGQLRQTVSAIVASEAEHLALIAAESDPGRPTLQAPQAFVTGRPG
ncbi:MAG: ferritin-like domain-containing protein [Thermoleophilaceae bacterium]